nr:GNAT family acetyltransferase [uncultured Gammaproteobacteria bacterium]
MTNIFRQANIQDAEAIAQLLINSWQVAYENILPKKLLLGLSLVEWVNGWKVHLANAKNEVYVLLEDQEIIGVAEVCSFNEKHLSQYSNHAEISVFYLVPDKVGSGYGKKMMDEVLSIIQGKENDGVAIWVLEKNQRARSFYRKFGFKFMGNTKKFPKGNLNEILYIRKKK